MTSDWQEVKLGDLGEVNRGKSKHRPRDAAHLYGGPYPFLQTGDIKDARGRVVKYRQTYSEAGLAQSRLWPQNTVAITIAANIAETAILSFPACFPDSVVGFVADPKKSDPRFIAYYFQLLRKKLQGEYIGSGSVQDNINLGILNQLVLKVPEVGEQRAIANLLGSLDDKIELNRRMNETLEAMAQAIFRDWFVDFGPTRRKLAGATDPIDIMGGLTPDPTHAAELFALFPGTLADSGLPEGWEAKGIDALAEFLNGLALQKFPFTDGAWLPAIKIAQLRTGSTENSDRVSAHLPPQYVVNDGDVLFSWSGSLTHLIWTGGCGALNQHLFKVTSDNYPKWFYYLWLSEHMPTFQAVAASKATTMGHIQRHHLTQAVCAVPPRDVIENLGRTIAPLIDRLTASKLESRTLAATRDLLLPKLMSGEIRLRDAENTIAEAGA